MEKFKITCVSAGNGSVTAAAEFAAKGHDVLVYETDDRKDILKYLDRDLKFYDGSASKKVNIAHTSNEETAAKGRDFIIYSVPGFVLPKYAEKLAPYTGDDTIIFFNAAASFLPLIYRKATGVSSAKMVEANSLSYATRFDREAGEISLKLNVKKLYAAAYPRKNSDELINKLKKIYPQIEKVDDIIQTCILDANPETHAAGSILNSGRIEYSGGEFYLYREGMTPGVVSVMRKVASERRDLGKVYGLDMDGEYESRIKSGYFEEIDGEFESENEKIMTHFNKSPVLSDIKGPDSVSSRYFTEDIALGLALWERLAKIAGIEVPIISSLINLGEAISGENYRNLSHELVEFDDASSVSALRKTM